MTKVKPVNKFHKVLKKPILIAVILTWSVYLGLTLNSPLEEALMTFPELTVTSARLLQLAIALTVLLIWVSIAYAQTRVYDYSKAIGHTVTEGKSWKALAWGLLAILIAQISTSYISLIHTNTQGTNYPIFTDSGVTILTNYIDVALNLIAYSLFAYAAWQLAKRTDVTKKIEKHLWKIFVPLVFIQTAYIYMVFSNNFRTTSTKADISPTYYLSDPLIVSTIINPTILSWTLGGIAVLAFLIFRREVRGILYKKSLNDLAYGILIAVSASILSQFLSQIPESFAQDLDSLLGLIAIFLFITVIGYFKIASGAAKLHKIEEV